MLKNNNNRKKIRIKVHKSLYHFFFVVLTLTGFLVALKASFSSLLSFRTLQTYLNHNGILLVLRNQLTLFLKLRRKRVSNLYPFSIRLQSHSA